MSALTRAPYVSALLDCCGVKTEVFQLARAAVLGPELLSPPVTTTTTAAATPVEADFPPQATHDYILIVFPGNPGAGAFYQDFADRVATELNDQVAPIIVSHAGHSTAAGDDAELYDLDFQIAHKIAFVETVAASNPNSDLIIAGHSIGAHMALSVLKARPELPIVRALALFPTLHSMAEQSGGVWYLTRPLVRPLAAGFAGLVTSFPVWLLDTLLGLFAPDDELTRAILKANVTYNVGNNCLYLAHTELDQVRDFDESILRDYGERLFFLYGQTDEWAPMTHYFAMREAAAGKGAVVDLDVTGATHAFVCDGTDDVALRFMTTISMAVAVGVARYGEGFILHEDVKDSVRLLWDNSFAEAEASLATIDNNGQPHPRVALVDAEIALSRALISGKSVDKATAVARLTDAASTSSKVSSGSALKKLVAAVGERSGFDSSNTAAFAVLAKNVGWDVRLVAAEASLHAAFLHFGMGNKLKGCMAMRSSWNGYHGVLKEVESADNARTVYDGVAVATRFGVGLFYLLLSLVPAGAGSTLLGFLGFVGDKDVGVGYLRDAVKDEDSIVNEWAALALSGTNVFASKGLYAGWPALEEAVSLLDFQLGRHPRSSMFLLLESAAARKAGNAAAGIEYARRAVDSADRNELDCPNFRTELATSYLFALEWEAAAELYGQLVNDNDSEFETKGLALMAQGACLAMCGRDEEAEQVLRGVDAVACKSSRFDVLGASMASRALRTETVPLLAIEVLWLRRDLCRTRGEHRQDIIAALRAVEDKIDRNNSEADAKYRALLGSCLVGVDDEAARSELVGAIAAGATDEAHLSPHCFWELAVIAFKAEAWDDAQAAIDAGLGIKGYDWEELLAKRFKAGAKQVAAARSGTVEEAIEFDAAGFDKWFGEGVESGEEGSEGSEGNEGNEGRREGSAGEADEEEEEEGESNYMEAGEESQ